MKTDHLADEELVALVRKDKEMYSELVVRYQKKLLSYANYILKNEHEAVDAVQEAFIKAYVNLNSFDADKKFSSWIYRIVHNAAMDQIRKRKNMLSVNEFEEIIEDNEPGLLEKMAKKERGRKVKTCLQKLPVVYREPIALFFLEDKSYSEISDILRIPVGTVGTNINRGKKMMKERCFANKIYEQV